MRGLKEFRAALDKHMKGASGTPQELRDPFIDVPAKIEQMLHEPHSLREGPEWGSSTDIKLLKCTCGRYHCMICDPHGFIRGLRAAVDSEIERRKKLK